MQEISLKAQSRTEHGKKARAAAAKRIPSVMYGHGKDTSTIWVNVAEFNRAFQKAGTNTLIKVSIDDKSPANVLIHDFQTDPITDEITHVDFFMVRMNEAVDTHIPLIAIGESPAVKNMGGTLHMMESLPVRALPGDLLHEIEVDISILIDFDTHIGISDLKISDKIEVQLDENTLVANIIEPRTQEEVDAADVEVDTDVTKVEVDGEAEKEAADAEAETEEKK